MDFSPLPDRLVLDHPDAFLKVLGQGLRRLTYETVFVGEMWALVGLAAMARQGSREPIGLLMDKNTPAAQFAHAVGFADVTAGRPASTRPEAGRTVRMTRVDRTSPTEPIANEISRLMIGDGQYDDTRKTVYYVLNELLRNTLQHSHDPLGGVVGAQVNDKGRSAGRPTVQVAVADNGIGIPASLKSRHPQMTDEREALDKAMWPHVSSAFDLGLTGSAYNAGMGLFFIAEMTKLVGGRLVVASRGVAMELIGDPTFQSKYGQARLMPGSSYPGTLVAFEMPVGEEQDYDAMLETIRERAAERTPRRLTTNWLRFETPPQDVKTFEVVVRLAHLEHAELASNFAKEQLIPRISNRVSISLNFEGIDVCTQSYVHALLFEPLRVAWALKVPVYVKNTAPAVKSTLSLLENYALAG